ncbi:MULTISPECIES: NUDIX domain-containing protein [Pseudomonas]|uniref:NUDIX domain-containing protein n=1 Tax=Pseudomonas TaxID=286 RepID=UPI001B324159|nr:MULTISPECIES: NUDIX domain-containing protein [Pseudomonas]MBP5967404.1 NUDIX domain-containing protein [Pseudomonas iridis]UHC82034.1 NUDIX domain-containing protein [Pseudomonas sp. NIBR-H-19]
MTDTAERVNIVDTQVLSHDWYLLKKITFDYQRNNGEWQRQTREVYDRGNGAAILLFNREKRSVVLTRQFRLPVFVNGHDGLLIEVAAGLLEGVAPEQRIRDEAEEETGYRVHDVKKVFEAYMSPGSVTEKLHFFIAEYDSASKVSDGGGLEEETEELEVLEWSFDEALAAFHQGEICDAKTIMLLQYAAMNNLFNAQASH